MSASSLRRFWQLCKVTEFGTWRLVLMAPPDRMFALQTRTESWDTNQEWINTKTLFLSECILLRYFKPICLFFKQFLFSFTSQSDTGRQLFMWSWLSMCCQSGPWQESLSSGTCSVHLILVIYSTCCTVWPLAGVSLLRWMFCDPVDSHAASLDLGSSYSSQLGGSVILLIHMLPIWILAGVTLLS